jgi:predicted nucleic acid-binding protein
MRYCVLDASVTLKWFFADRDNELFTEKSTQVLLAAHQKQLFFIQPPHWLAEVAAVLSREIPNTAKEEINQLQKLSCFKILTEENIYTLASELAITFNHHLFDTLYHAVAIHQNIPLITADDKYYHKAFKK